MYKLLKCSLPVAFIVCLFIAVIAEAGLPPCASPEASDHAVNASTTVPGVVEGKVCKFCHVPHQDSAEGGMLWGSSTEGARGNKAYALKIPEDVAVPRDLNPPFGKGRLCMSCHDGTVAMPSVERKKQVSASSCVNWRLVAP